jgi:hypothetical protein
MKTSLLLCFAILLSTAAFAQTLGSCQIFPSNNPWNVRVDTMRVDSIHSAAYIASVGGSGHVHPDFGSDTDYGIPWEAVNGSQTFVSVNTSNGYQDQSDPGPMPIPLNPVIEHDGDSHVLIVDTSNHHLYELYQAVRDKNDDGWAATSSAIFGLDSNNYRPDGWTSCDAAGLPIFPGLVRLDECKAGVINHALRFTAPSTQQAWIFPARHHAGSQTDTNHMPMGTRLRLKASYDDTKDTGYAKVIITALKKYGIILADNGSAWYISGEWNPNWPDNDIGQLKAITGGDFEVVNTGYPMETESKEYPTPVIPIPGGSGSASISTPSVVRDTSRVGNGNSVIVPVSNTGSATLTINRYWLKYGTVFHISDSIPHSIQGGGNAITMVNFNPIVPGQAVDTFFIASNDATHPTIAVAIVGWGTKGSFHLSANPLYFGNVMMGASDTMWVELNNSGDGELDVYANSSSGTNPDFTLFAVGPQTTPPFVLLPGDTEIGGFQFSPTVVGPDTSIFSLSFADTNGGIIDTSLLLIGEGLASSSVAPVASEQLVLAVFPNPSSGEVSVSLMGTSGTNQIEITDALGRSVLKQTISSGSGTLDISALPNGCYFLCVQTSQGDISKLLEVLH